MTEHVLGIKIVGVDRDLIRVSEDKKETWIVPFRLSAKPDQAWERKFYEVQQKDISVLKKKGRFVEDCIELEVAELDSLQNILDVLKAEVAQANALCEEDFQKKVKIKEELEALQKRQRDATEKFKEDSDTLNF